MGEYLTIKAPRKPGGYKSVYKAGTCEDWRYIRHDEVTRWAPFDASEQTDCHAALTGGWAIFRFPYPDEDDQYGPTDRSPNWSAMSDRAMENWRWSFPVPAEVMEGVSHKEVVEHIYPHGGGYGINIKRCCPLDPSFVPFGANIPKHLMTIVGEKYDDKGSPRTIFACAWCGSWFAITSEEELEAVKAAIAGRGFQEIAERVKMFEPEAYRRHLLKIAVAIDPSVNS